MIIIGILACIVVIIELTCYTFFIPDPSQKPLKVWSFEKHLGTAAYITAYTLSLLRAPLGLLPYLAKLFIFFVLRIDYESTKSTYFREVINMVGDFVNLGLTTVLIVVLAGPPRLQSPIFILYIPPGAELIRLIIERVPITFSAMWQLLPHRRIAHTVLSHQERSALWKRVAQCLARYCRYYSLSDIDRTRYILRVLKHRATCDRDMSNRLEYVQALRIIPQRHGLRSGRVRDVANAEVFIHRTWTNDPWLLVGMAIRRAPWMFDPRYLRRPFYYMTEANPVATLFVLQHARYSPPYAVFQFGHEMRVARLHLFYRLLRWLGADIEEKVRADGTFQFDQLIYWLAKQISHNHATPEQRPLYSDDEVIADLLSRHGTDETITAEDITSRYTYPLKYVAEVLLDKINTARAQRENLSSTSNTLL